MAIALRKPAEIDRLRKAGQVVGQTLQYLQENVHAGMTLRTIDTMGETYLRSLGAEPSFKGLYGFPAAVCTSRNEVIIHGVPTDTVLEEGDILGIDIGSKLDKYYGDAAVTIPIGTVSPEDDALIQCAKDALTMAIGVIRPGMRFKELSYMLEAFITERGYVPLRDYSGHGIGTKPHEEPSIPNYLEGKPNQGPKIKNGMVFCIEPMVCQQGAQPVIWDDNWSVESEDGLRTAHYEHQVAVVDGRAVILTEA